MRITVKSCIMPNGCFSREQLEEIAAALQFTADGSMGVGVQGALNGGIKSVWYGKDAPFDTCQPWQKVNDCGEPIGKVKFFKGGRWT